MEYEPGQSAFDTAVSSESLSCVIYCAYGIKGLDNQPQTVSAEYISSCSNRDVTLCDKHLAYPRPSGLHGAPHGLPYKRTVHKTTSVYTVISILVGCSRKLCMRALVLERNRSHVHIVIRGSVLQATKLKMREYTLMLARNHSNVLTVINVFGGQVT